MRIVVFGYGAVGRDLTARLAARGETVVVAQRSRPAQLPQGAVFAPGDVTDRAAVAEIARGADSLVCAVGFPYRAAVWESAWPAAMTALLAGAAQAGARFVFADNLYMHGPRTQPLREDDPLTDYGRKPRLRADITRAWKAAHNAGDVRAVAVRAPDFYGPRVETSVISQYGVARLLAGKPALIPYACDFPHDYAYVPDVARALVELIDAPDDACGQAWNVPSAPTRTLREILTLAAQIAGVPLRIQAIPGWAQRLVGLFEPNMRELVEMRFQTDRPYLVDHSKFSSRFGWEATSFEDGLAATITSYRAAA